MAQKKYPLKSEKQNRTQFIKNNLNGIKIAPSQFNILPIWKLFLFY